MISGPLVVSIYTERTHIGALGFVLSGDVSIRKALDVADNGIPVVSLIQYTLIDTIITKNASRYYHHSPHLVILRISGLTYSKKQFFLSSIWSKFTLHRRVSVLNNPPAA